MNSGEVTARLAGLRGVMLDLDGTLYLGDKLFAATPGFLNELERSGVKRLFLTNNDSHSVAEYQAKFARLGLQTRPEEILTAGQAAIAWLRGQQVGRVFLLGMPALAEEFRAGGLDPASDRPEWVVLAFDRTLTYDKMQEAAWHLQRGVPLMVTHPDYLCPDPRGPLLDTGSLVRVFEKVTAAPPVVLGKPHPSLAAAALERLGRPAGECAMVGDRLMTDIRFGRENGLLTVLVFSGETTAEDLEASPWRPHLALADVGELGEKLAAAKTAAGRNPK